MDCDDVILLLSATDREPTPTQQAALDDHVAGCEVCAQLVDDKPAAFRWVVRIPADAIEDPDLLVLPTVDPIVFIKQAELAHGGMGRITRARDRRLGRDVAIKEILAPHLRPRFEREARITARLQHPAIVPIYEAGAWPDGSAFYTMRLVPGRTLAEAIDATASLEQRLALLPNVIAVTEALAYAHARRIVHRDVKPANVLVGELGETVVIDWGLAKELEPDPATGAMPEELTRAGAVIGTPGFMPPEQAQGEPIDERADVYALGALLYNVLGGKPPYYDAAAITPAFVLAASCEGPPRPLGEIAPRVPADLVAIVARAMGRTVDERYPTAKEMAEELRRFAAGKLLGSREYSTRELVARWIRRHRVIASVVALTIPAVAIAATVAVAWMASSRDGERDARRDAESARRDAEHARDDTARTFDALLEEHGRSELLAGEPERALAYLAPAYAHGRDGTALRELLASAAAEAGTRAEPLATRAPILAAGFTPDGRVVTVEASDSIATWTGSSAARAPLGVVVARACLTGDARRAAIVTDAGRLGVFDTATGDRRWWNGDGSHAGADLRCDPTGARLVVFHASAELLDAATGAVVARLTERVSAAAFSSDGTRVAIGGDDGSVAVWEASTGARVMTGHAAEPVVAIAFDGDDHVITGGSRGGVLAWSADGTSPIAARSLDGAITALVAAPHAHLIACADDRGTVRLMRDLGETVATIHVAGAAHDLVFSPDERVLVGHAGGAAFAWDANELDLRRAWPSLGAGQGIAWDRGGVRFVAVGGDDRVARVASVPRGELVASFAGTDARLAGSTLLTASSSQTIVRRLDTGEVVATQPAGATAATEPSLASCTSTGVRVSGASGRELAMPGCTAVAMSPDGELVAAIGGTPAQTHVWRLASGEQVAAIATPGATFAVFDPPGRRVAIGAHDGTTMLLDLEAATIVLHDTGPAFALAADGARFATGGDDGAIRIWDAGSSRLLDTLHAGSSISALAWSADGSRLVAEGGGRVSMWDLHLESRTASEMQALAAATGWILDGARLK